jgi:hypothetical protein
MYIIIKNLHNNDIDSTFPISKGKGSMEQIPKKRSIL